MNNQKVLQMIVSPSLSVSGGLDADDMFKWFIKNKLKKIVSWKDTFTTATF